MQGEGKRSSAWISLLTAGKHDGGYSMEGDRLRAEGEFLVLFDIDWNKSRTNNKGSPWR